MPDNRELKHALYRIAAVGVLVPPVVAATLIAVAGSYPMPEGYLSLLGYTGIYFAVAAVLAFGWVVPRAHRAFTKLGAMPAPEATHAESAAPRELPRDGDVA
ncbi:MAG: hypothetical protein ACLFPO_13525, partial [Spirochaetaceae bacterium]